MTETTDGFAVASADLKIRGQGNIMGTEQSGTPEKQWLALFEDTELVHASLKSARHLMAQDSALQRSPALRARVKSTFAKWSRIG